MSRIRGLSPCQLLKTGQTTSYETGDDGDLEKGVSRSYTVLTTGNYSGTTNITVNAKTVALSNNCVIDECTGLMWARYIPQSDIGPDNNGKLLWKDAVNSEDIFEFCAQANAANLGGYNDWRLPNITELCTTLDYSTHNPAVDITIFPSNPSDYVWSSSTFANTTTKAWYVRFSLADTYGSVKITEKNYCRLVRDN